MTGWVRAGFSLRTLKGGYKKLKMFGQSVKEKGYVENGQPVPELQSKLQNSRVSYRGNYREMLWKETAITFRCKAGSLE